MNLSQKKKKGSHIHPLCGDCETRKFWYYKVNYEWKQIDFKDLNFIVVDNGGNTTICGLF